MKQVSRLEFDTDTARLTGLELAIALDPTQQPRSSDIQLDQVFGSQVLRTNDRRLGRAVGRSDRLTVPRGTPEDPACRTS